MRKLNTKLGPAFYIEKRCEICKLDLQLFAEGDGSATASTGETAKGNGDVSKVMEAQATTSEQEVSKGDGLSRAAKRQAKAAGEKTKLANPLAQVKYGRQETQAAAEEEKTTATDETVSKANTQPAKDDKATLFEKMIRGEYKEQFQNRTQSIINQRFKELKTLQAKNQRADELIDKLAKRYGVDNLDLEAIAKASAADESYTEQQAKTRGLSVEEVRRMKALESENARLRSNVQMTNAQKAADKIYSRWVQDGAKLKEIYPEFNFTKEVKNPEFSRLLRSGVSLRKAYEASHLDKILGGAMQYTADQVTKGMVARITDRSGRPAENSTTPRAGVVVKNDVSGLSRSDREEIERRVMRGEKILF